MSELITAEWLRSQDFQRLPCIQNDMVSETWWHEELRLEIRRLDDGPVWLWRHAEVVEMRTLAAVEALMHWVRVANNPLISPSPPNRRILTKWVTIVTWWYGNN